ncbi:MAG: peptidase E [Candidatus Tectimicrobiota bacterium]|nr:MAG: peptidase E [Candidatus Tectomicrobia bacterium]
MAEKRLLLLSNSTNYGGGYLEHARAAIQDFLGQGVKRVLFVPFAAVRLTPAAYAERVRAALAPLGYAVTSLHEVADPQAAVGEAEALVVGGGNTFVLLQRLYAAGLLEPIRQRVAAGVPYLGWSAGANVACPTIKTTNDMPIVAPPSLRALGLVPFQINPHYTDATLPGYAGETRAERLAEFVELHPGVYVVGLREGSLLRIEGTQIQLLGPHKLTVFCKGQVPADYAPHDPLAFLWTSAPASA